MRKKRNKENKVITTKGYIKTYFGNDIGRILMPSNRSLQNCNEPYVTHEEAEMVLNDCLISDFLKDKSLVFTGLTGSGKTTILRHVFGLETNANRPQIKGNTLIIPIDFNRSQSSAQEAVLSSLRVAVEMITNKYNFDYPGFDNEKFYNYINIRRPDLLRLDPKSDKLSSSEQMDRLLEKMPTPYASCQLQFAMDQPECLLELVVLVVDNIEAFINSRAKDSKTRYLAPVIEAFKLAECIHQRGDTTKWSFNMVIACRHHIWRIMKGELTDNTQENVLLQSYITTERPYDLASPVEINDIILKREEIFSQKHHSSPKWKIAVNVVNTVLQKMENSIGDFVLQLELKDLRKSMAKMQEIILHKGLQKQTNDEIASGAFEIDSVEQFDLTKVNLIRTIGIGDYKYYSDLYSIIPNLLYNERQDGFELYPILTLKYFLKRCDYTEPAWDNPISISTFYESMKFIFGYNDSELSSTFIKSVRFLIQHRLLLRSADQPQEEVPGLSEEEINKIEFVYVSGAAVKLWEELKASSALFQLYIDDIWIDDNLDFFGNNGNNIEHCIKYLKFLKEVEERIYNSAKNKSTRSAERYLEVFGTSLICEQLLAGLISSLETICSSNGLVSQNRVSDAEKALNIGKTLFSEMIKQKEDRKRILK